MTKPVFDQSAAELKRAVVEKRYYAPLAEAELDRRQVVKVYKASGRPTPPVPPEHRKPVADPEDNRTVRARTMGVYDGVPEEVTGRLVVKRDQAMNEDRTFVVVEGDSGPLLVNVWPESVEVAE